MIATIIFMAVLVFVIGYAVWCLVIARGATIDPYDRLAPLTHDPKDEWRTPATPVRERRRRVG